MVITPAHGWQSSSAGLKWTAEKTLYVKNIFFCWDKLDNFGVMPGFLYYMTLKKDVFSGDCYYK